MVSWKRPLFVLGTVFSTSQDIANNLTKDFKGKNKLILVEDPQLSFDDDLRLENIDYNIFGDNQGRY